MSLRMAVGAWCALLCCVSAAPARASAVFDFRAGSGTFVEGAAALLDGNYYASAGTYLAKPPGTLNMTVPASSFGINLNATVDLQGVELGNNTILYSFDKTFSPPLDLGGGVTLRRGWGSFQVRASLIPGANSPQCNYQPCLRNVYLDLLPGGSIFLEGDGWSRTVTLLMLKGVGGVPQPSLAGFTLASSDPICSSETKDTVLPITAFVSSVAPSGGAKVDFTSSYPQGLYVPPHHVINAGKTWVSFNAKVKAGFDGIITLTAAANGATLLKPVVIHEQSYCEPPSRGRFLASWLPDLLAGCAMCSRFVDHNDIREALGYVDGRYLLVKEREAIDIARHLQNESLDVVALSNNGLITGRLTTREGSEVAYRASLGHGVAEPEVLGKMTPTGINSFGVVVGYRSTPSGPVAVYHDGKRMADLPLGIRDTVLSSQATGVNDAGYVIGTYQDSRQVVHGFVFKGNTTHTLPTVGSSPALPVAVNRNGELVAQSTDQAGNPIALFIGSDMRPRELGLPAGFTRFEAKSLNRAGWIVGTASNSRESRAFLYRPASGWVDISLLAPEERQPFQALEALRVTDSNQIVVQGTLDRVTDLYVLSF